MEEKIQLPKIRKILPTNLIDINYFVDLKKLEDSKPVKKLRNFIIRIKSTNQSPKITQTTKAIHLRSFNRSTQGNYLCHSKEYENEETSDFRRLGLNFLESLGKNKGKEVAKSLSIKKGLSGHNISKLHYSRFEIKNRSRYISPNN